MPDEYEERFGLNPDVDDSGLDPDDDGLTNDQERVKGTDPTDPDSDDGGEVDGTDANPFDPADDAVRPPRIVAYPGDGEVLLRYTVDPNYSQLTVKRGDNPGGPFSLHTLIVGLNGAYIDNTVTNGNTYCYQVFALSPGHRSVNAPVTCATSQGDHYPPYGTLKINRGAASTLSPQVILDIWAKDGYDNALQVPGDAYELLGPGVDSGIAGMMISNNPGFKSAVWLRYATVKDWILAGDRGLNYVYIKFRDDFGNISDTFSAAIYLNTGPGVEEIFLPIVIRP